MITDGWWKRCNKMISINAMSTVIYFLKLIDSNLNCGSGGGCSSRSTLFHPGLIKIQFKFRNSLLCTGQWEPLHPPPRHMWGLGII